MEESAENIAKERKKIMFYDTPERQADLKIRLKYDNMTQSEFLRFMVSGCINRDPLIQEYLSRCKQEQGSQGRQKQNKINTINKKTNKNIKKFALDKEEIEDIFDMIEVETNL